LEFFDQPFAIDVLGIVDAIPNAVDPNIMIASLVEMLCPFPIGEEQTAFLKEILIPGLPDFEWTVEYGQYLNDPTNDALRVGVENRLRALFIALLGLPEFQLQ